MAKMMMFVAMLSSWPLVAHGIAFRGNSHHEARLEARSRTHEHADSHAEAGVINEIDFDATNYPGIKIRTKDDDPTGFEAVARAALNKIIDGPTTGGSGVRAGRMLMTALKNSIKVKKDKLEAASESTAFAKVVVAESTALGSKTVSYSDSNCVMVKAEEYKESDGTYVIRNVERGPGAGSTIQWVPTGNTTPDGDRPPFIGLAHELVHALHDIRGELWGISNPSNVDDAVTADEARTAGLGRFYEDEPINENRIRDEHGITLRATYTGKVNPKTNKWVFDRKVAIPTGATTKIEKKW